MPVGTKEQVSASNANDPKCGWKAYPVHFHSLIDTEFGMMNAASADEALRYVVCAGQDHPFKFLFLKFDNLAPIYRIFVFDEDRVWGYQVPWIAQWNRFESWVASLFCRKDEGDAA